MITYALTFVFACFGLALLMNLYRVLTGPELTDRIIALDTMVINTIAALILYGILRGTTVYFEAAMLFGLVGFVSTVAYCRYVLRGAIIE
ncbi:MAG TPA: K+/H+ antiporter subunit F [Paracoccus sp.]|nr:K+/H+ antiporter subunit F [Paracoccus sp. (in: a-proteobacteria)]